MDKTDGIIATLTLGILFILAVGYSGQIFSVQPTGQEWTFITGCNGNGWCYSKSYDLGDVAIKTFTPDYQRTQSKCQTDRDFTQLTDVPDDCVEVEFNYGGKTYVMNNHQTVSLNKYISVRYDGTGLILNKESCHGTDELRRCQNVDYDFDWEEPQWSSTFTFKVQDDAFIEGEYVGQITHQINDSKTSKIQLKNNLFAADGGVEIHKSSLVFTPEASKSEKLFNIPYGSSMQELSTDLPTVGDTSLVFDPFIIVNNKVNGKSSEQRIYAQQFDTISRVLPNVQGYVPTQVNNTDEPEKKSNSLFVLYGIIAVIIIGGVIYYVSKQQ